MDDAGFSEQLQQLQEAALLTPKEADFRQYLVKTGVAEDIVKVLVGLEETEEKPVDAEGFVREHYGSRDMALVSGRPIDKINEIVGENEALKARVADLESQFAATLEGINRAEAKKRQPALDSLMSWHPHEAEEEEDEEAPQQLDLAKTYSALVARFPAEPPAAEEGEPAPEPAPWAAESAEEPPTGGAPLSVVERWALACFGMDGDFKRRFEPALFDELVKAADPTPPAEGEEPPPPVEMARALQLHAAFWALVAENAPVAEAVATDTEAAA